MLFNSLSFLIFFSIVTPVYYFTPFKWRWLLLLLASCYFYAFFIPAYLLVLFSIILIDYTAARLMEGSTGSKRKALLILSIVANLGVLAVFKYYNFFVTNVNDLLGSAGIHTRPFPLLAWALPLGLSFHTFQAMSYTIEVYKGNHKAERHPGIYALYVMFYPQLVAGPIERPAELLHQFYERHPPNFEGISDGLKKMLIGLFMKVVVADRLAIYVDYVYGHVGIHGRLALLTAVFFYAFQIYCDFAGYSLIAIGAARTMGFTLADNFRQPYLAASITRFWGRWHMTLYRWFRDYLYIPLGGGRVGMLRHLFNIFVVFLLSGLWHGANWTFIVWGALHGILVILETVFAGRLAAHRNASTDNRVPDRPGQPPATLTQTLPDRLSRFLPSVRRIAGILYTFTLVSLCLVFFRAANVADAMTVIRRIFNPATIWQTGGEFRERALLLYSLFGIGCILAMDIRMEVTGKRSLLLYHKRSTVRLGAVAALVVIILLLGVFDGSQFIYFQF